MVDINPLEHFEFPRVPHYYGDAVRGLFIGAASLMIISAPFYTTSLMSQGPFIILWVLILVALAAMTNPRTLAISVADSLAAVLGVVFFGIWSLVGYESQNPLGFVFRGAIALLLLFAFYFSMKTVRAMMQHKVGKPDTFGEFN